MFPILNRSALISVCALLFFCSNVSISQSVGDRQTQLLSEVKKNFDEIAQLIAYRKKEYKETKAEIVQIHGSYLNDAALEARIWTEISAQYELFRDQKQVIERIALLDEELRGIYSNKIDVSSQSNKVIELHKAKADLLARNAALQALKNYTTSLLGLLSKSGDVRAVRLIGPLLLENDYWRAGTPSDGYNKGVTNTAIFYLNEMQSIHAFPLQIQLSESQSLEGMRAWWKRMAPFFGKVYEIPPSKNAPSNTIPSAAPRNQTLDQEPSNLLLSQDKESSFQVAKNIKESRGYVSNRYILLGLFVLLLFLIVIWAVAMNRRK